MNAAFNVNVDYEPVTCCSCGLVFAVPKYWVAERRADHVWFKCPNNHNLRFGGESKAEELEKELAQTKQYLENAKKRTEWAENDARKAKVAEVRAKNKLKRVVKRVECGVCPHCRRSFENLQRHMKTKHARG
jgi:hypothetical protein